MKLESKFGIGEIVCTKQTVTKDRVFQDAMFKIVAVTFAESETTYLARLENGQPVAFMESELIGDPDFDQEHGYPTETR
jgi:hypothetical protein